ncbi:MAG: DUF6580 family putative transport protein [Patescibacteria group bacterium]
MKKLIVYSVFILAFIERVWFDFGPNIELITLATILSAFYLDRKTTLLLTLAVVAGSDILIGNSNIFIFTWSGFILPILAINIFKNLIAKLNLKTNNILSGTLAGVSSNIFFFLWTNLGVWALDSWGMYPNTALGLLQSYINSLPFLKYQLTSTLFFVPIGFLIYEVIFNNLHLHRTKITISHMEAIE